jgi:sensor c-di-GMP phosphodiesterase-like protein
MTLALGHLAPLMTARPEFFITLNFSSNDLDNDRSISQLETMTARYGLDPGRVHIELTERSSVATDAHIAAISRLRSKGFEVGTDDFGVGFSNLEYLTRVPLDYLKIDRTLVASARDGSESRDIVETVVRLARSRGIRIIAEGVETEAQRLALLEAGVEYGQGWLFGRPMSALEFIAKFARFGGHRSAASRELVRILSMPRGSSAYR